MCGIIGYVGPRECQPLLIHGLQRLEYRGYDSAGIALLEDGGLHYTRAVGNLANLRERAGRLRRRPPPPVSVTRAGRPTAASPRRMRTRSPRRSPRSSRSSSTGSSRTTASSASACSTDGHAFSSETDAETVTHLIEEHYDGDLVEAVRRRYGELEGHFAFVAIHRDHPGVLVGARLQCPMVVGLGRRRDATSRRTPRRSCAETRVVQFPNDGEIAVVTPEGSSFLRAADGAPSSTRSWSSTGTTRARSKGGYETFMLKEIHEQPDAVAETIGDRVRQGPLVLEGLGMDDDELRELSRIVILAGGHRVPRRRRSAVRDRGVGARAGRARHRVRVDLPQPGARPRHARDRHLPVGRDARHDRGDEARAPDGRPHGRDHEHDGLADHPRGGLGPLHARGARGERRRLEDVHGAAQRCSSSSRSSSRRCARRCRRASSSTSSTRSTRLPAKIEQFLDGDHPIDEIARRFHDRPFFLYLGRNIGLPVALEGALKLKEISYIPTEAYSAGEMKHGPIALLDETTPVVVVATRMDQRLRQARLEHPGGARPRRPRDRDRLRRERGHPAPRRRRDLRARRRRRSSRRCSPSSRCSSSPTASRASAA